MNATPKRSSPGCRRNKAHAGRREEGGVSRSASTTWRQGIACICGPCRSPRIARAHAGGREEGQRSRASSGDSSRVRSNHRRSGGPGERRQGRPGRVSRRRLARRSPTSWHRIEPFGNFSMPMPISILPRFDFETRSCGPFTLALPPGFMSPPRTNAAICGRRGTSAARWTAARLRRPLRAKTGGERRAQRTRPGIVKKSRIGSATRTSEASRAVSTGTGSHACSQRKLRRLTILRPTSFAAGSGAPALTSRVQAASRVIRAPYSLPHETEFTSHFFFNEGVTDVVHAQSPYNTRGTRNTRNSNDGIYNSLSSSEKAALTLNPATGGSGYAGVINLGVRIV